MRRWTIFAALVVLSGLLVVPSFAQGPGGRGLSALVCLAEQVGFGIGNGEVSVEIENDVVENGIGHATVTIHHGRSQSTHLITYEDSNDSEDLDCGDVVLSVS